MHEASCPEEPGAGKLHAGICEGGAGQPASLPRHYAESNTEAPFLNDGALCPAMILSLLVAVLPRCALCGSPRTPATPAGA